MLGNNLLTGEQRVICKVYGVERHLEEKYAVYHEYAETFKEILKLADDLPEDERRGFYMEVAKMIGGKAGSDEDFQRNLKHHNIEWDTDRATDLKYFLGRLALENGRAH